MTIVTVVKDDEAGLTRTMDSLRAALTEGVRWLVLDGSTDGDAVSRALHQGEVPHDYEWAEPAGVYGAMNTALRHVRGDYTWFINAGDRVHSVEAVADVLATVASGPLWAFGRARFIDEAGSGTAPEQFDYEAERRRAFARGRFPPHQATVVRTEALGSLGGFSPEYRVAADYALMLRLSRLEPPAVSEAIWADFYEGGLSTVKWRLALSEFHRARRQELRPRGLPALAEWADTAVARGKQGLYRGLLAPGRPLGRTRHD